LTTDGVAASVVDVLILSLNCTSPEAEVVANGTPVRSLHGRLPESVSAESAPAESAPAESAPAVIVPLVLISVPSDTIVLGASRPSPSLHTNALPRPRLISSMTRDVVVALRVLA
jgi:hypothetical protein